jgi:hypothetical protein
MRLLIAFLLVFSCDAATHWASPTGTATYASCSGSTPLSGTSACSLSTTVTNAVAGDLVYLRAGTYSLGGGVGIQPGHSGTSSSNMITFQAYTGETPTLTGGSDPFWLSGNSYVSIKGLSFTSFTNTWGRIDSGGNHNEIALCTFTISTPNTNGQPSMVITGAATQNWVTHNWIHNNHFVVNAAYGTEGAGCTDGGGDVMDIGAPYGAYAGNNVDNDNNNTIENNFFEHDPHAAIDGYGIYTVIRNNIFHNEPFASGCSVTTNYVPNYTNTAYNGMYGHRDMQYTEDYQRVAQYTLLEGNRWGYASINQDNDGAENVDLAAPQGIFRYNFIYASMGSGLQFKYGWGGAKGAGGNGGTYNRVYNNTLYNNGLGWPAAVLAVGDGCNTSSCPFAASAISTYSGAVSATGNVLKNNLIYAPNSLGFATYHADAIDHSPGGSTPPFSPTISWSEFATATNNWCTASQSSSGACSAFGNPLFNNPDITTPSSQVLPDLTLQSTSAAIDGGTYLTTSTNSGSGSTSLTVADALYFQDGTWGSDLSRPAAGLGGTMQADWIAIGTVTNRVQISAVVYGTYSAPAGTITLASPMTWSNGASIWLYKRSDGTVVLSGAAPDYGASEYTGGSPSTVRVGTSKSIGTRIQQ